MKPAQTQSTGARSRTRRVRRGLALAALLGVGLAALQCSAPGTDEPEVAQSLATNGAGERAWATVYAVLQHPRCLNCHPAGDVPLQGDDSRPHAQNVQRGRDGEGLYAMRCATCHQEHNLAGPNLPPGAPHWKLPAADMKLVFEGRSSGELCRQLRDPAQNGGKTREQLFEHMAEDELVRWGWDPGAGRAPVATPFADVVAAMRSWVDHDCECPER